MPKKYNYTMKTGRPSKKDTLDFTMLKTLASFGLTDVQLASVFRVTEQTINQWKKDDKVYLALKEGKDIADAMVERSLFERAMGYSHPEEEIFCYKGEIIRVETIKHYPPDTIAEIFWLKNRQPDKWREKHEFEHTGDLNFNFNLKDIVSDVERGYVRAN